MLASAVNINIVVMLFLAYYWRKKGLPKSEPVLLFILTVVLILVPLANLFYKVSPLFKNIFSAMH
jgi:RsiW-degrading membrane proteinase PrsW (M82 family)